MHGISPEEKLLRLIRGKKKEEPVMPPVAAAPLPVKQATEKSLLSMRRIFSAQKIIWAIFILSLAYLLISLAYPLFGLKNIKLPEVAKTGVIQVKTEEPAEKKPYDFYLEGTKNRRIFGVSGSQLAETGVPTLAAADMVKDLSLIGIISGSTPQAVIEDKKNQKTYYLTKGQFIGESQVEDIQEGKIILNHNGQRYELYM